MLVYSDTENLSGILQLIEEELGWDPGDITGNAVRLKKWTAEVNLTHDDVVARAIRAGGTWQFDDANHAKFPFIRTNLVSGQKDYTFSKDQENNLILDIYRVMLADSSGYFREIDPVDMQTRRSDTQAMIDGQNGSGVPTRYDKTANGIILDPIPNYNSTLGLKVFINREGSHFATTDTTKSPGVDGRIHEYYVVAPAYKYAARKGLAVKDDLLRRKLELQNLLEDVYGVRHRDEPRRMTPAVSNCR